MGDERNAEEAEGQAGDEQRLRGVVIRGIRGAPARGNAPLGEAHRDPCGGPGDCEADGLHLAKVEHVRRRPAGCAEGVK